MHLWLLMKDAWHTQSWWDKIRIWLMPLGWRPNDVALRFPVYKIEDVYQFEKYNTANSRALLTWTWIQMLMVLLFISYLFGNIAHIGVPDMFVYGGFIFLSVYAYTELLDHSPYAFVWELLKNGMGIYLLIANGDWFGAREVWPGIVYLIYFYFGVSLVTTGWFCLHIKQKERFLYR
jgi:alkylglycerol monooxygenase